MHPKRKVQHTRRLDAWCLQIPAPFYWQHDSKLLRVCWLRFDTNIVHVLDHRNTSIQAEIAQHMIRPLFRFGCMFFHIKTVDISQSIPLFGFLFFMENVPIKSNGLSRYLIIIMRTLVRSRFRTTSQSRIRWSELLSQYTTQNLKIHAQECMIIFLLVFPKLHCLRKFVYAIFDVRSPHQFQRIQVLPGY